MHYVDEGQGPVVLCLHGNPTWSFFYRGLLDSLTVGARVIAPDMLGFGLSEKNPRFLGTPEWHARNLMCFIRSLKLRSPFTMVVHDWGGPIGLDFATKHPKRIGRLVLLNTWAFTLPPATKLHPLLELVRAPGTGEKLVLQQNYLVERGIPAGTFPSGHVSSEVMSAYRKPFPTPEDRQGMLKLARAIPVGSQEPSYGFMADLEKRLNRLKVATDIFWGMRDPVFSPAILKEWEARLPHARVHRLPDAAHFVAEDTPGLGALIASNLLERF